MRFTYPEYGTERIRKAFAWFPKDIGRTKIWLEYYWVKEYFSYRQWNEKEISFTEIKPDPAVIKAENIQTVHDYLGVKK